MNESLAGDYPAATDALDQATEIIHDLNDPYLQAFAFFATGLLQRLTGRYEAAMASYEAAVRQFDALDLVTEGAGAAARLREALTIYRRIGAAAAQSVEETLAGLPHRAPEDA